MPDWLKVPYEERLKKVTHYKPGSPQSATVRVGFEQGGYFFDLYISMHKSEVKRKGLIEYHPPKKEK